MVVEKNTQISMLSDKLKSLGYNVAITREPSDGPVGELIRKWLRGGIGKYEIPPEAQAMLYSADRVSHNENEVFPLLRHGCVVLSERYLPSTWAYQHYLGGIDEGLLHMLHENVLWPDLTIFLYVPPEIAMKRIRERLKENEEPEKFEKLDLLEKLASAYKEMYTKWKEYGVVMIDGNRKIGAVFDDVWKAMNELLEK